MQINFRGLAFILVAISASSRALAQELPRAEEPPAPPPPDTSRASCSWKGRCDFPKLVLGLDAGISHFSESGPFGFGTGTGSISALGPSWGLRAGVELTRWFAVEAHYSGMHNGADSSVSVGGSRGLLTNAVTGELRFTAPIPYVQPYVFFGAGWYSTSVTGSSTSTELFGSSELGVPLGVGFQVPLPRGLSLGAEATYHRLFGESFSDNEDIEGGDPFTLNAVLRFRL